MDGRGRYIKLCGMMGLLYAVQGAWWPLLAVHLKDHGITGPQRGWIFACQPLGTLLVSLGVGGIVDRIWPIQRVLAVTFFAGTFALAAVALGLLGSASSLFMLFFVYWLFTAPCIGLSNTLAFRHLSRPGTEFAGVRLWGTVGWMAIGWVVSGIMAWSGSIREGHGAYEAFWVATALSLIFAIYAWTLPHTPPLAQRSETDAVSTKQALRELIRKPGMVTYLITAFGVCLTTPFVFQVMPTYLENRGLPRAWTATVMTIGQWPEIAAIAILPWLITRFDYKKTIALGLVAWLIRFGSLALNPPLWIVVGGTLLHGIGIACISIGGQVFVDQCAPTRYRATAQALNMSITSGLGALMGSLLAGRLIGNIGSETSAVFLVPCLIQAILIVFFWLTFCPKHPTIDRNHNPGPVRRARECTQSSPSIVGALAVESADG